MRGDSSPRTACRVSDCSGLSPCTGYAGIRC